ncbi:hypothetical protein [Paenibacillus sp. DMB5]|uniref:hypothetical protein n=1 Tax=Paenibacillus sp. DMB5 TaxID=1780103 RepID=UPI00076C7EEF|nr:hypothetical protein [Paenibacillus sp. DMB5]KUP25942.1 hypothetical protein AWJ19_33540 [Paenibacillus sp. DMB5]
MSRLVFNKLILLGAAYKRTIIFNKDLTVISGDKTSGKSLILSLIDYCLGKDKKIDLKVQKELNLNCDQVYLEIMINEEVLTIARPLKENQTKLRIYFASFEELMDYTPKIVSKEELMQFFMRKLNINEYKLEKYKQHSNKKELATVSFRDIFRYVYINQHQLGTHDFLSNNTQFKSYKNPHAFKLMFGLVEPDVANLKQQLVNAKNRIEDLNKEILGLESYLKDKDAENYIILWEKRREYKIEVNKRKAEKAHIIENGKRNKNNENEMYITLKRELTDISNQISELENKKSSFWLSVNSKKLLMEEYQHEKVETDATLEINYKLVINEQNVECPLCNSKVPHLIHNTDGFASVNALNKIKSELANKTKLINKMIENDLANIDKVEVSIRQLNLKKSILDNAILEFTKKTEVPFLSQIDSINSIINRLSRENEIIKECLRIHNKIIEKKNTITDLEAEVKRLEGELANLNVSEKYKTAVFNNLNENYKAYMKRFNYTSTIDTYIHPNTYIPYYDGSSVYDHESGGLLLCMQVSYLGAIVASKKMNYAIGHPGILMLDSLSKYLGTLKKNGQVQINPEAEGIAEKDLIKDPEVYEEIYKILIELCSDNQIIIVENTPPDLADAYTRYTFFSGDKGLVNLKANEYSDSE